MKRLFVIFLIPVVFLSCKQSQGDKAQTEDKEKSGQEEQSDMVASTKISKGQEVPDFTFTTTGGKSFSMTDLRGKVVLLNFFATWCPTCLKEMPALQNQIWEKYRDNEDFFLVSIGREQDMNKMKEFKSKKGYEFPFAPDTGRVIYGKFAEKYIPRNVVVNPKGTIVYQGTGYSEEEFQKLVDVVQEEVKN